MSKQTLRRSVWENVVRSIQVQVRFEYRIKLQSKKKWSEVQLVSRLILSLVCLLLLCLIELGVEKEEN